MHAGGRKFEVAIIVMDGIERILQFVVVNEGDAVVEFCGLRRTV